MSQNTLQTTLATVRRHPGCRNRFRIYFVATFSLTALQFLFSLIIFPCISFSADMSASHTLSRSPPHSTPTGTPRQHTRCRLRRHTHEQQQHARADRRIVSSSEYLHEACRVRPFDSLSCRRNAALMNQP